MLAWGRLGWRPRAGGWSCWADLPRPAGPTAPILVILPTRGLDSRPSCPLWPHKSPAPQKGTTLPVPLTQACGIQAAKRTGSALSYLWEPASHRDPQLKTSPWVGPAVRGAPGLTSSPPTLAAMSCGDHPALKLLRPPRRPRTGWSAASGLGQRQQPVSSGLVWARTAGQAIHTSMCFNLVQ